MSDLYFVRPTGAGADTKELEYLTALHQSEPNHVRGNATVSSLDILRFLRSRFNINLTHDQALYVVRGLSGDSYHCHHDDDDDDDGKQPEEASLSSNKDEESEQNNGDGKDNRREEKEPDNQPHSEQQEKVEVEMEVHQQERGLLRSMMAPAKPKSLREALHKLRSSHRQRLLEDKNKTAENKAVPSTDGEIVEEYLDLVQILSILLIPSFARLGEEAASNDSTSIFDTDRVMQGGNVDEIRFQDAWKVLLDVTKNPTDAPQTPDFVAQAFEHMLRDLPDEDCEITPELIEYLFLKYGEVDRAKDKELIDAMVEMAKNYTAFGGLSAAVLLHCSTSDLGPWDVATERRLSSFFVDVFGERDPFKIKVSQSDDKDEAKDEEEDTCLKTNIIALDPETTNVDMVTDSHLSLVVTVLIWGFFFLTMVIYSSEMVSQAYGARDACSLDSAFWCEFVSSIYSWAIIAITFSLFGLLQVSPLSIGNQPHSTSAGLRLLAAVFACIYSLIPFLSVELTDEEDDPETDPNSLTLTNATIPDPNDLDQFGGNYTHFLRIICLCTGLILAALYILFTILYSSEALRGWLGTVVPNELVASHSVRGYTSMKRAANYKLTKLLINAYVLHNPNASKYFKHKNESVDRTSKDDIAMKNFVLYGDQRELAGGILWTWKRLLTRSLFEEEGVWISSRLVVIQFAQLVASALVVGVMVFVVPAYEDDLRKARDELPDNLPSWVYRMVPEPWMLATCLYPAAACAGAVKAGLIVLYIPSTIATIFKFRGQLKSSLGDPAFLTFRNAVDSTYMNLSNAVYGLLAASLLWYLTIALFVFLYVWPVTQETMVWVTAWLLGLGTTIGLKMILTMICQKTQYRAFFRIQPRGARLSSLALECWFIGLGGGVLLTRLGQFLGGAAFWIGRIDVPFLADDISLIGVKLDMVPTYFIKDILVHESHRHPYMERLARLYVMKARHGDAFVSRAGAAWRQLILLAFMPWIARYRVSGHEREEQALEAIRKRNKLKEEEANEKVAEEEL